MAHVRNPHDLHGGTHILALSLFWAPARKGFPAHRCRFWSGGSLMEPQGARGIQRGSKKDSILISFGTKGAPGAPYGA